MGRQDTAQFTLPAVMVVLFYASSSRWPIKPCRRLVGGSAAAVLVVVGVVVLSGRAPALDIYRHASD